MNIQRSNRVGTSLNQRHHLVFPIGYCIGRCYQSEVPGKGKG
jgi:hypothetical protein